MGQLKKNLRELARIGDESILIEGFNRIADAMRIEMESKLRSNLTPPTQEYMNAKGDKALGLRRKGLVAKKFRSPGKGKSFVAVDYRFGPHAHWFEFGTGKRFTTKDAYRGKIPGKKSRVKLKFFRPVVDSWKHSGRFVSEVRRIVHTAVQQKASGFGV